MAAFDPATLDRWRALAIVDRDGTTVGTISEFYLDRETGYPTWALVNTGLFGSNQTFVPLVHATEIDDGLQVPYEKRHIKDTPSVDLHDELSPAEEATLFAHYGVEYQPSEPADAGSGETGSGEAPGPVPAEPGSVDPDGTVGAETGSGPLDPTDSGSAVPGPTTDSAPPHPTAGSAPPDRTPGSASPDLGESGSGPPGHAEAGSAPPNSTEAVPGEPGTEGGPGDRYGPAPDAASDPVPDEPGTTAPDETTGAAPADPDLDRTAPVEPGLPGSTAAAPYGPGPTTIDKGAAPSAEPGQEPFQSPAEAGWPPNAAGSFEENELVDRPAGSSDRWREAKLAAERDRIARAAAQPEERSPLERARRRLERLVGGGQEPPDHDDTSPADRDAAERARRARLGFDDDNRTR
jgi:hypothetical protein